MLEGEIVRLRAINEEDFVRIARWGRDDELKYYMEGDYPTTVAECGPWLDKAKSDPHAKLLGIALRSNNLIIGDVGLSRIAWRSKEAELGIRIGDHKCWNQGIGTEAVSLMLAYGFDHLSLNKIYLRVYDYNQRAIHCYSKCGFREEGFVYRQNENKQTCRIILMSLASQEYRAARVPFHPAI
ncbi:MAG: GNAT family N-acetyltransferase [Limnochordia bacterium]|jgi:RimJ/RimL family protein N-acetyltransferase|nr:GNAT family protein [Limnochordia bacterium]